MYARIKAAFALLRQAAAILFFASKAKSARDIFVYWDGEKTRRADPLTLYRLILQDAECSLREDLAAIKMGDWEALDRVQGLIRRVFGTKTFEEGGLTQKEADTLLAKFLTYVDKTKKKAKASLPLSPPSGLKSSTESARSTTKRSVVLSGIPNESKSGDLTNTSPPSSQPTEDLTNPGLKP